jgi:hypothetical protein
MLKMPPYIVRRTSRLTHRSGRVSFPVGPRRGLFQGTRVVEVRMTAGCSCLGGADQLRLERHIFSRTVEALSAASMNLLLWFLLLAGEGFLQAATTTVTGTLRLDSNALRLNTNDIVVGGCKRSSVKVHTRQRRAAQAVDGA